MKRLIYAFVFLLSVASCLDDKTNYDYRDINDWTMTEREVISNMLEDYVLYPGESITIEPVVRLSMDTLNPDVSYVWYINGEKVGEKATFTYVGEDVGTYNGVVSVIDNATNVSWSRGFTLIVNSPIETGWLFLTRSASGASEISMLTGKVHSRVGIINGYEESIDTVIYDNELRYNLVPNLGTGPRKIIEYYAWGPENMDVRNELMVLQESGAVEVDGGTLERILITANDFEDGVGPADLDVRDAVLSWDTKWLLNADGKVYGALATTTSDLHSGTYSLDPAFNGKLFERFFPFYKAGWNSDHYQIIIAIGEDGLMYGIVDDGKPTDEYSNDYSVYYDNHNGTIAELTPADASIDMSLFENIQDEYIYASYMEEDYYESRYFTIMHKNGQYLWHEFGVELPYRYTQGPLEITSSEVGDLNASMFTDFVDACLLPQNATSGETVIIASGNKLYGAYYASGETGVELKGDFPARIAGIEVKDSRNEMYHSQLGVVLEDGNFYIFEVIPAERNTSLGLKEIYHLDLKADNPGFGEVVDFIVKYGEQGGNRSTFYQPY